MGLFPTTCSHICTGKQSAGVRTYPRRRPSPTEAARAFTRRCPSHRSAQNHKLHQALPAHANLSSPQPGPRTLRGNSGKQTPGPSAGEHGPSGSGTRAGAAAPLPLCPTQHLHSPAVGTPENKAARLPHGIVAPKGSWCCSEMLLSSSDPYGHTSPPPKAASVSPAPGARHRAGSKEEQGPGMCTRAATTTLRQCPLALNDESHRQTAQCAAARHQQWPRWRPAAPRPRAGQAAPSRSRRALGPERVQPDPPRMLLVWLHKGWI